MKLVLPAVVSCFCLLGSASGATTLLGFSGSAYLSPSISSVETESGKRITDWAEINTLLQYGVAGFLEQDVDERLWFGEEGEINPVGYAIGGVDSPQFSLFDDSLYGSVEFFFVGGLWHDFSNTSDMDLLVTLDLVGHYDVDYFSHLPNARISAQAVGYVLGDGDEEVGFMQDFAFEGIGSFSQSGVFRKSLTFGLKAGEGLSFAESTGVDALISIDRPTPIPLPASLPLLLAGLAGIGWMSRRRRCHLSS